MQARLVVEPVAILDVAGAAVLAEERDTAVPLLREVVRDERCFLAMPAVREEEAVLAVELRRPDNRERRHLTFLDVVAQHDRVVAHARRDHQQCALVDEAVVRVDDVLGGFGRQPDRDARDELDRVGESTAVHRVLEGENERIDDVGEDLARLVVDDETDANGLMRVRAGVAVVTCRWAHHDPLGRHLALRAGRSMRVGLLSWRRRDAAEDRGRRARHRSTWALTLVM